MVSSENTSQSLSNSNSLYSSNFTDSPKSKDILKNKLLSSKNLLKIISDLLTEICEEENINTDNSILVLKPFLSKKVPSISIYKYLKRLSRYTKMNNSTLILTLIYIDKVCEKYQFKLNFLIIHKIILASLVSAIKYNEDEYYSIDYYSKSGGVSKQELMNLEYEFLVLIDFNLYVKNDLFEKYERYLLNCEENEKEEGKENEYIHNNDDEKEK